MLQFNWKIYSINPIYQVKVSVKTCKFFAILFVSSIWDYDLRKGVSARFKKE